MTFVFELLLLKQFHVTKSHIYHCCFRKNADGTNRVIANKEACLVASSVPFWKYIDDIPVGVRTRNQYKNQELVTRRQFDNYFRNKNKEAIEQWETAPDSDVYYLKASDPIYVIYCT